MPRCDRKICHGLAMAAIAGLAASAGAEETVLWPQVPTRIDRSKQTFERLPAVPHVKDDRLFLAVPERIAIPDSTSFAFSGITYRLDGIIGVGRSRVCRNVEGGRWSCGRMAAILLGNLVRGKRLLCHLSPAGNPELAERRASCSSKTSDLAARMLEAGYARAKDRDGPLALLERQAQAKKVGLWRNPACISDFDGC